MKKLLTMSLLTAGLGVSQLEGSTLAGDCCHEGGVSYHGRIVMKIHRTWLGASPAPMTPIFVNQAPPMIAVPYVSTPVFAGAPMVPAFQAAPLAPPAPPAPAPPAAPAALASATLQNDLDDLRSNVKLMHEEMVKLAKEVKAIREKVGE
jgi:hypothetical protein